MAQISNDLQAAIAATRFGLGAKPGEIDRIKTDPKAWLAGQIRPEGADQPQGPLPGSREEIAGLRDYQMEQRQARRGAPPKGEAPASPMSMNNSMEMQADAPMTDQAGAPAQDPLVAAARRRIRDSAGAEFLARARLGANTDASFRERWALFWFNHFTVSAVKLQTAVVTGPFEREAIRPLVFGRFEDLLAASTRHPGMLLYLDQAQSFGPNSLAGKRRGLGLNENLAREILELHTVGVDAGYSQADVTEFARALTGWSIGGLRERAADQGGFVYRQIGHEPGVRQVMGRRYQDHGEHQARAILKDLAADPKTARRISRKLAAHFVADDPPPALVDRLTDSWTRSGGDLSAVAHALIEAPEAWDPEPRKFKTPYEYVISGYRTIGVQPSALERLNILTALGQRPFAPPSPKGWPDEAGAWAAPDAVIKRLEWAKGFSAAVADKVDPVEVAKSALGARMGERTAKAVARAETRQESLAVLLMSPEFQRR